jgi:ketosteroid isomerase-like protein
MRYWLISTFLVAVTLAGCAAPRTGQPPKPLPSGFASADAKNVHDFLVRYQTVVAGEDEKAILRLYADDARMVPYLVENKRVLARKDLASRLGYITKMQRRADMRLAFREPMDIQVPASGETAQVRVLADLDWREAGAPRHMVLDCYFRLVRDDFIWKIKESHQDVAAPGQTLPGKGATPGIRSGRPGPQDTDTTPQPIVPGAGQNPQPLF